MPRPKHLPRIGPGRNRHPQMTVAGELYAAALSISLDRTAHPLERARANLTMRELAEEMRLPPPEQTHAPHTPADIRALRDLVVEAIDERSHGVTIPEPSSTMAGWKH